MKKYLPALYLIISYFKYTAQTTINGDTWIVPDVSEIRSVSFLPSGASDFAWSTNGNQVTLSNSTSSVVTILISKNTGDCSFKLFFDYKVNNVAQTKLEKTIKVAPFLQTNPLNSVVFPGESISVVAQTPSMGTCSVPDPLAVSTVWSVTGGASCFQGCNNGYSKVFNCNSTGFSNQLTVSLFDQLANKSLKPLSINVKLRDPVFNTAPTSIGCGNSPNGVVFSVNPPTGASHFVWTYPSSLLIPVGSVNGSSITFDAIQIGAGNISVQAFASNGSTVSSNVVISPQFTICCSNSPLSLSDPVNSSNSPYLKESGSTINSVNNISATGGATIHAADEVKLSPGFNAITGCEVHIYNAGCNGTFSRQAMPIDSSNIVHIHQYQALQANPLDQSPIQISELPLIVNDESHIIETPTDKNEMRMPTSKSEIINDEVKIFPNPTEANFTVQFNTTDTKPSNLFIYDRLGQLISTIKATDNEVKVFIDLGSYSDGIYAIRIEYSTKIISRVIIKNSKNR